MKPLAPLPSLVVLGFLGAALLTSVFPQSRYEDLTEEEAARVWVEEIVPYIITKQEREAYERLTTSEDRVRFIESFWRRRDPTPETEENEYQLEHYRRLAFVNQFFGAGRPGWKTDRGRMYILLGPPDAVDSDPMGRWAHQFPTEVWIYRRPSHPLLPPNMEIAFVDRRLTGDYELTFNLLKDADATRRTEMLMDEGFLDELARAEVRALNFGRPGTRTSIADGLSPELERLSELALVAEVPERAVRPLSEEITTQFTFDTGALAVEPRIEFYRTGDGTFCIPVNLNLPYKDFGYVEREDLYESRFEVLGRIVDPEGNTVHEYDREEFFAVPKEQLPTLQQQSFLYQLVLYAPAGEYTLQIAVRDGSTKKIRMMERDLRTPVFDDSLALSTVVLADQIVELDNPPPAGTKEPFTFGEHKVLPNATGVFAPGGTLRVRFEVYNLALDHEGNCNVMLEYVFRREGRLYRKVPASYPFPVPRRDRTIMSSIPLDDFPPGDYSLTVSVTDEVAGKTVTSELPFKVR